MDMYIFAFPITSYKVYTAHLEKLKLLFKVIEENNMEKTVYKCQLIVNKKSKYWHDANVRTYLPNALDDHAVLLKVNMSISLRKSEA